MIRPDERSVISFTHEMIPIATNAHDRSQRMPARVEIQLVVPCSGCGQVLGKDASYNFTEVTILRNRISMDTLLNRTRPAVVGENRFEDGGSSQKPMYMCGDCIAWLNQFLTNGIVQRRADCWQGTQMHVETTSEAVRRLDMSTTAPDEAPLTREASPSLRPLGARTDRIAASPRNEAVAVNHPLPPQESLSTRLARCTRPSHLTVMVA